MADDTKKPRNTLSEDEIRTGRALGRRSVLLGAAAGVATLANAKVACAQSGITDSDTGGSADPAGNGRGSGGGSRSGLTDSDSGASADPAGNGRGGGGSSRSGLTDSDSGASADPAGNGR
ncbi:MAG: hypothetical protein KDK12_07315, partial [Rhodobacteraceae bacterium]|nr:hypothetical protein [Paracoccaceae bacterium]